MGFLKGSQAALDHMARIRSMRKNNKISQSTINASPVQPVQPLEANKKRGKLIKGSIEAREYMASIRPRR